MAIGNDRVQLLKQESTSLGGDDNDIGIYGSPSPIEPQEDAIETAGIYFQDEVNRDEGVAAFRNNLDFAVKDKRISEDHHLYQFSHFWWVVPENEERIVKAGYEHLCSEMKIKNNGVLVLENDAHLVIV